MTAAAQRRFNYCSAQGRGARPLLSAAVPWGRGDDLCELFSVWA